MGICLNMIVKNEAKNLKRLFASLYRWIDYYVISDTGSTDNTIELIRELGQLYKIDGVIEKHDWVNFAHNRNLSMQAAVKARVMGKNQCNWLMIIDADEELVISDNEWKKKLMPGFTYTTFVKVNGIATKRNFLIWMPDQQWEWKGKVHNYLFNLKGNYEKLHTNGVYIEYHQFEGSKSKPFLNPIEKNKNDIEILLKEIESLNIKKVQVQRFFQLAYSYKNINDHESCVFYLKKILNYPEASLNLRYISLVFIAKSLIYLKKDYQEIQPYLLQAISLNDLRKEAYYYLAFIEKARGNLSEAKGILEKANMLPYFNPDFSIWEENIYTWKIKYDLSVIYYQLNNFLLAKTSILELIQEKIVPEIELGFLKVLLSRL
jgi:hypothetical protein